MLQTCCAISRKNSQLDRRQILPDGEEQFGRPIEDRRIGLLDISNSNLEHLPIELLSEQADGIEHLILDENQLDEKALEGIPELPNLKTLSLNGNSVKNIGVLFQVLCRKVPQIVCLSLIGNPGWPHPILNGNNLQLYRKYALSAAKLFPTLQFLDTARVSTNLPAINKEGEAGVIAVQNSSMGTFVATACHII